MFTGLIEAVCKVRSATSTGGPQGRRIGVDLQTLADGTRVGDSIAVNGACLTVTAMEGSCALFDISPETIRISTLGTLRPGVGVHVERALRLGDRLGGHWVQGHVDGTATLQAMREQGQFTTGSFLAGKDLLDQMILKGSVAVDGISLTVAGLDERTFSVAVIPQTLKATTLGLLRIGDKVNIETDLIIKTVRRYLEGAIGTRVASPLERLLERGF